MEGCVSREYSRIRDSVLVAFLYFLATARGLIVQPLNRGRFGRGTWSQSIPWDERWVYCGSLRAIRVDFAASDGPIQTFFPDFRV